MGKVKHVKGNEDTRLPTKSSPQKESTQDDIVVEGKLKLAIGSHVLYKWKAKDFPGKVKQIKIVDGERVVLMHYLPPYETYEDEWIKETNLTVLPKLAVQKRIEEQRRIEAEDFEHMKASAKALKRTVQEEKKKREAGK